MGGNPLLAWAAANRGGAATNDDPRSKATAPSSRNGVINDIVLMKAAKLQQSPSLEKLSARPQDVANDASLRNASSSKKFSVGDRIRASAMPKYDADEEAKMALLASRLRPDDCAWVKRSDGSWGYARVGSKIISSVVFVVNANGDTKTLDLKNAGRYVRIVSDEEIITEARVAAKGGNESWSGGDSNGLRQRANTGMELYRDSTDVSAGGTDKIATIQRSSLGIIFAQVECKTNDGEKKTVPMFKAGTDVRYRGANDDVLPARVLDVHLDGLLEPYYTIRLEDGREKQTDSAHIMLPDV